MSEYPMRINKYLAHKNLSTRREADELIKAGKVLINGNVAKLGDKVNESDVVETRFRVKQYRYFAYNKPRGVITHSAQEGEKEIKDVFPVRGVFPIGRLDKDSSGLIILTDDGRITDKLLNPEHEHEKEYIVTTKEGLKSNFKKIMEGGVDIEGYRTKKCEVTVLGEKRFSIVLTEGKKHQIRRMCAALGYVVSTLERTRVMNIHLSGMKSGAHRALTGSELTEFLKILGF
jgi:23S rRNA pseudouridine2604 synthase